MHGRPYRRLKAIMVKSYILVLRFQYLAFASFIRHITGNFRPHSYTAFSGRSCYRGDIPLVHHPAGTRAWTISKH